MHRVYSWLLIVPFLVCGGAQSLPQEFTLSDTQTARGPVFPYPHYDSVIDEKTAWAGLLRTVDGGQTWHALEGASQSTNASLLNGGTHRFVKTRFVSPLVGWLAAQGAAFGGLWMTTDGGRNWKKQLAGDVMPGPVQLPDQSVWAAVSLSRKTFYLKAPKVDAEWTVCGQFDSSSHSPVHAPVFMDGSTGWAISARMAEENWSRYGVVYTTDGGCNWSQLWEPDSEPYERFSELSFSSRGNGWMVGQFCKCLYRTEDGGRDWTRMVLPGGWNNRPIEGVFAERDDRVWLAVDSSTAPLGVQLVLYFPVTKQFVEYASLRGRTNESPLPLRWTYGRMLEMIGRKNNGGAFGAK